MSSVVHSSQGSQKDCDSPKERRVIVRTVQRDGLESQDVDHCSRPMIACLFVNFKQIVQWGPPSQCLGSILQIHCQRPPMGMRRENCGGSCVRRRRVGFRWLMMQKRHMYPWSMGSGGEKW
jgi:hypothetical protein